MPVNRQYGASYTPPHPKPTPRRMALIGAAALVTLAAFALGLYIRQLSELPPLSPADLLRFEFDPYAVGFAVQELAFPLVLIYIFSTTTLFKRILNGETVPRDTLKLFGVLAAIQLLTLSYYLLLSSLADDQVTFGVLIVVTGSLLGGWRVGVGLGLITMFVNGTQNLVDYPEEDLLLLYHTEGLRVLLNPTFWYDLLVWRYLVDMEASSALWAGIVAALGADLLGQRRFVPAGALTLQIGIEMGVGYLTATAWDEPAILASFLIPSALISGLAMLAITLMVRNVQAEAIRRKAEAAQLALARAELRALRAQINPHFLFNALNTIRYFVRTDTEVARRLLLDLSEVFQRALRSGEFVPLRDELSYVEAYLALEKARLDQRLQVTWLIQTDADTYHHPPPPDNESSWLDYPVPTLILQPIVENAVIHGIAKQRNGGTVNISVKIEENDLLLQVEDNGLGIEPAQLEQLLNSEQENAKSIGLRNVDRRLRTLYGDEHRLVVSSEVGGGTHVKIRIPVDNKREG